jgi:hypothetical protein
MESPETISSLLWEPDWAKIEADPVRREHEAPWIEREIEHAMAEALIAPDQQSLAEWRGRIAALKMVLEEPRRQVERIDEEAREEELRRKEAEENGRRARFGNRWLRRLLPIGGTRSE